MSYASVKFVLYGIKIHEDKARQIYDNEYDEESGELEKSFGKSLYKDVYYRPEDNLKKTQNQPVTPYKNHDTGSKAYVFDPQLLSDETDSRIHSLIFDQGYDHYLGIYVASNGYAYSDKIKEFITNIPPEAIKSFETGIRPLMEKYSIIGTPDIHLITQVW